MKKKLRGYIFSRSFMNERVPQNVQNTILRDYCLKNKFEFLLSATEYFFPNSHYMLEQTIKELNLIDGIVAYSIFQMPKSDTQRNIMLKEILKQKKQIHFAVENLYIKNLIDLEKVNEIWLVKKSLAESLSLSEFKKGY